MNHLSTVLVDKYNQVKNFFIGNSNKMEKAESLFLNKIEPQSYSNVEINKNEKIILEKRRRYQAYMALDYFLSLLSYFDFFSIDSFKIVKKAKDLAQFFENKVVPSELLLLPFFESNKELLLIFEKHGITEKELIESISNMYQTHRIPNQSFSEKILKAVKNILISIDIPALSESLIVFHETKYSSEVRNIFRKAAENALTRFKTPVINSEILLITILEAKESNAGKLLKKCLKDDLNWYMFRYSLMKRLHRQELAIRTEVPNNYQYFAYLLKTQLPEYQFDSLIEKDCLLPGILLFRNYLLNDVIQMDLHKKLKEDIIISIRSAKGRQYSSSK